MLSLKVGSEMISEAAIDEGSLVGLGERMSSSLKSRRGAQARGRTIIRLSGCESLNISLEAKEAT